MRPCDIPNANAPPCDPSLWIVHYLRAEQRYNCPVNQIPVSQQMREVSTQRRYLQQHGQLVRKEFMLHDRNNWPTVNFPVAPYGQPAMGYPGNVISHMNRNQQSYMQQQQAASNQPGMGPSPAKRQRQQAPNLGHGPNSSIAASAMAHDPTIDEEEDTSRGDIMDFLTPRDISTMRYQQHHEWMEEVVSSPYATSQIIPVDLGIGRKGELEDLTRGFFEAPTSGTARRANGGQPPRVGKMEAGKAEEFIKRATEKANNDNDEIEEMKKKHAKQIAKFKHRMKVLTDCEKALRTTIPTDAGTEFWRMEGSARNSVNGDSAPISLSQQDRVDEICRRVEAELEKRIVIVKDMECIQKGGLEEKTQTSDGYDHEYEMGDPLESLDDQHSLPISYPVAYNSPSAHRLGSSNGTPQSFLNLATLPGDGHEGTAADGAESTMPETSNDKQSAIDGEGGDWVMVNKNSGSLHPHTEELPDLDSFTNDAVMHEHLETTGATLDSAGDALDDFTPGAQGHATEDFSTNDFSVEMGFGNLDTAGDALSGYGEQSESMGLDEHGDLGLDDSAFGEAFHGTEANTGHEDEMAGS